VTQAVRSHVRRLIASQVDQPNVVVQNFNDQSIEPWRIKLSTGTIAANECATRSGPYKRSAFLPAPPWRRARVEAEGCTLRAPRLGYFTVPSSILCPFRNLTSDPPTFTRADAAQAAEPLAEYLGDRFGASEAIITHGLNHSRSGLETVTVNPETGLYIGLHIDSWDGNSFDERRNARTRISVNVGSVPRYLLVLNMPFDHGADLIKVALSLKTPPPPHRVLPALFMLFPEIPVLRIQIQPGEAYVADTDNLIHDASTLPNSSAAFHCTFRAHWSRLGARDSAGNN
jgi:hypothetical protein